MAVGTRSFLDLSSRVVFEAAIVVLDAITILFLFVILGLWYTWRLNADDDHDWSDITMIGVQGMSLVGTFVILSSRRRRSKDTAQSPHPAYRMS